MISGSIVLLICALLIFYRIFSGITGPHKPPIKATTAGEAKSSDTESVLFSKAADYEKKGEILKARDAYQKMIERFPDSKDIQKAQEELDSLNIKILFSPIPTADSFFYVVEKGDNLVKLAKKFGTTKELIAQANSIKDGLIKIGKALKISKAKFSIVVDKSQNILTLKSDGNIIKTYRVSTGKNNSTPAGSFKITSKLVDPPWYPPTGGVIAAGDPKNVLGSRWLGISQARYGIHGTIEPESIGKSVTEGCVRMKNPDVEELYTIVPEGTEVVIVD